MAIDLCAGSGWGVACQILGIDELGVEIMPEAIQTREAAGMYTLDKSISDLPDNFCSQAEIQIAGPPCQTFSSAGIGEGMSKLGTIISRISHLRDTGTLIRGGDGDPRTWLVLEPLRLAIGGLPTFIVWEQVPGVLPVWQACAEVLEGVGYSVWTGILNSEQYGVPQTRKRAFLIARKDGVTASPPVATHSRYHNRNPSKLDPGVLPWVSMAEALGWGVTVRPSFTVTGGGGSTGGAEPFGTRSREALISYRNGNQKNAAERPLSSPAPTVHFGSAMNDVRWVQRSNYTGRGVKSVPSPVPGSPPLGARELNEPSATVTSKSHKWSSESASIRVTVEEAAILQTFPPDHPFRGSASKRYLQIGNAVPPMLGVAILSTFLADPFAD